MNTTISTIRKIVIVLCAFATIAALASIAAAQNPGSITGTVTDPNGGVVPGASVTVENPINAISRTGVTSDNGNFTFAQLPPGTYTITVEKSGFKRIEKSNVILSTGDNLNAGDLVLEAGDISATVQVQADAGQLLLKSESGERADVVSGNQLRNIGLNGRNVSDLAKLVPGVVSGGAASGNGSSTVNNVVNQFP